MIFLLVLQFAASILLAQAAARSVATAVGFLLARDAVFHSRANLYWTLVKYVLLVVMMGSVSYAMIRVTVGSLHWNIVGAKMASELLVYIANFAIQRDVVVP